MRYSKKGDADKVIVHIQDAHCNYPAQKKVADIIAFLNSEYGITQVNLEGGKDGYDLTVFERIDDAGRKERVSDHFVGTGEVNGAEYFAINNPEKVELWGIEDEDLYMKNLGVYRDSLVYKEEVNGYIRELDHFISNLKRHMFGEELMELDRKYAAYKDGTIEFKDYVVFLLGKARSKGIDIKTFTNIYLLSQAIDQEENIDFKRANKERELLLDKLKDKLSVNDSKELVRKSIEFKQKLIPQNAFYEYLISIANKTGNKLDAYPELQKFVIYISLYNAVDKFVIMQEMDQLESAIKEGLYSNDKQRELNVLSKNLILLQNMFDLKFTKDDYSYYLDNINGFDVNNYVSFINENAPLYKMTARLDPDISKLDGYRDEISGFFEYSFERDNAFMKNMKFTGGDVKSGIMVTGGFHTENMCELFEDEKISYISIMPNFKMDKGYESPYFEILSGGVTDPAEAKIYQVLSQFSMMQIASKLSGLGEAVWGAADMTAFQAAVNIQAELDAARENGFGAIALTDANDNVISVNGEELVFGNADAGVRIVNIANILTGNAAALVEQEADAPETAPETGTASAGPGSSIGRGTRSIGLLAGIAALLSAGNLSAAEAGGNAFAQSGVLGPMAMVGIAALAVLAIVKAAPAIMDYLKYNSLSSALTENFGKENGKALLDVLKGGQSAKFSVNDVQFETGANVPINKFSPQALDFGGKALSADLEERLRKARTAENLQRSRGNADADVAPSLVINAIQQTAGLGSSYRQAGDTRGGLGRYISTQIEEYTDENGTNVTRGVEVLNISALRRDGLDNNILNELMSRLRGYDQDARIAELNQRALSDTGESFTGQVEDVFSAASQMIVNRLASPDSGENVWFDENGDLYINREAFLRKAQSRDLTNVLNDVRGVLSLGAMGSVALIEINAMNQRLAESGLSADIINALNRRLIDFVIENGSLVRQGGQDFEDIIAGIKGVGDLVEYVDQNVAPVPEGATLEQIADRNQFIQNQLNLWLTGRVISNDGRLVEMDRGIIPMGLLLAFGGQVRAGKRSGIFVPFSETGRAEVVLTDRKFIDSMNIAIQFFENNLVNSKIAAQVRGGEGLFRQNSMHNQLVATRGMVDYFFGNARSKVLPLEVVSFRRAPNVSADAATLRNVSKKDSEIKASMFSKLNNIADTGGFFQYVDSGDPRFQGPSIRIKYANDAELDYFLQRRVREVSADLMMADLNRLNDLDRATIRENLGLDLSVNRARNLLEVLNENGLGIDDIINYLSMDTIERLSIVADYYLYRAEVMRDTETGEELGLRAPEPALDKNGNEIRVAFPQRIKNSNNVDVLTQVGMATPVVQSGFLVVGRGYRGETTMDFLADGEYVADMLRQAVETYVAQPEGYQLSDRMSTLQIGDFDAQSATWHQDVTTKRDNSFIQHTIKLVNEDYSIAGRQTAGLRMMNPNGRFSLVDTNYDAMRKTAYGGEANIVFNAPVRNALATRDFAAVGMDAGRVVPRNINFEQGETVESIQGNNVVDAAQINTLNDIISELGLEGLLGDKTILFMDLEGKLGHYGLSRGQIYLDTSLLENIATPEGRALLERVLTHELLERRDVISALNASKMAAGNTVPLNRSEAVQKAIAEVANRSHDRLSGYDEGMSAAEILAAEGAVETAMPEITITQTDTGIEIDGKAAPITTDDLNALQKQELEEFAEMLDRFNNNLFGGEEALVLLGVRDAEDKVSQKKLELLEYMSSATKAKTSAGRGVYKIANTKIRLVDQADPESMENAIRDAEEMNDPKRVFAALWSVDSEGAQLLGDDYVDRLNQNGWFVPMGMPVDGQAAVTPVGGASLAAVSYFNLQERATNEGMTADVRSTAGRDLARGLASMTGRYDDGAVQSVFESLFTEDGELAPSGSILIRIRPIDLNAIVDYYEATSEVMRSL